MYIRQIEKKFYQGTEPSQLATHSPEPESERFMSFLDFQKDNLRSQRIASVGSLLVGQLRQVPGLSVAGAEAISAKLGGTMALLDRNLRGMAPGEAQVMFSRFSPKLTDTAKPSFIFFALRTLLPK